MPRCIYGPHRLIVGSDGYCQRCGEDLRLYAALEQLPVTFYNRGRALWDQSEFAAARATLEAALTVREEFPEAHWLIGMVHAKLGNAEAAGKHLTNAFVQGAPLDQGEIQEFLLSLKPAEPDPLKKPDSAAGTLRRTWDRIVGPAASTSVPSSPSPTNPGGPMAPASEPGRGPAETDPK
jgi:tetratricopeptide (TPR) repeat protein